MTATSSSASVPIADDELDDLFVSLSEFDCLILAVSGGADSMALMHLAARWLARKRDGRPEMLVVTIDHGLRPESAREAAWVAQQAKKLGLSHETLTWKGEKPRSGIQEAAREARYRLLDERSRVLAGGRRCAVVTAHHREDQAETFLMRLARGSGLDGLCGMPRARALRRREGGPGILRPLLGVPKSRLLATLTAHGVSWIEDPSNERTEFERVRIRRALSELEKLGVTAERISESVSRLQRAREALESAVADFERGVGLEINRGAYACFDRKSFLMGPLELRVRLMARLLEAFGGQAALPRLSKIEALVAKIEVAGWRGSTLGGCVVARQRGEIRVLREPGRAGLPEVSLAPGERAIWDRRFVVWLSPRQGQPVAVRALGAKAYARLASLIRRDRGLPARAAATLPAFFRGEALIAVPQLAWGLEASKEADVEAMCTSEFIW
jgi:tRNA(Ile)-lysidine synthase